MIEFDGTADAPPPCYTASELLGFEVRRLEAEAERLRKRSDRAVAALVALSKIETRGHGMKENYYGHRASQYAAEVLAELDGNDAR